MYKISVIIPLYNVEKYVDETMDSLIKQTIGFENLQVIIVDDHSTDNSKKNVDQYAEKYENVQVFQTEKNSTAPGKPRNLAIEHIEGKYIMCIDPDDIYEIDACEKMYNAIEKTNSDIVTANYTYMDEDGTVWNRPTFDLERFPSREFDLDSFGDNYFIWNSGPCNKIYRSKIILENKIRFLEGVPAEDAYFTYAALLKSNKIFYLSDNVYLYRRRRNTGNLSVSWDRSMKYFEGINYAYKQIYQLFEDADRLDLFRYFYAKTLTSVFYKTADTKIMSKDEKEIVLKDMKWFYALRKQLGIEPCQKSLEFVFEMIENGNYGITGGICNIISEMREYVEKDVRENMSKPDFVNYVEL